MLLLLSKFSQFAKFVPSLSLSVEGQFGNVPDPACSDCESPEKKNVFELEHKLNDSDEVWRRDWRSYSKESICQKLALRNWNFTSDSVQAYWDQLKNQLIQIVDGIAPMVPIINKNITTILK